MTVIVLHFKRPSAGDRRFSQDPSKSPAQHRFMEAVAHDPEFRKKVGVPKKVGEEFTSKDGENDPRATKIGNKWYVTGTSVTANWRELRSHDLMTLAKSKAHAEELARRETARNADERKLFSEYQERRKQSVRGYLGSRSKRGNGQLSLFDGEPDDDCFDVPPLPFADPPIKDASRLVVEQTRRVADAYRTLEREKAALDALPRSCDC